MENREQLFSEMYKNYTPQTMLDTPAPKISVVMSVYNAENYLGEAIESILNQTFTDFEFLIFNNGSTEDSLNIIKKYTDSRIRVFDSIVGTAYTKHLNNGIAMARGKYIARMDADDISLPTRFEKQYNLMEEHPEIGLCSTWIEVFYNKNKFFRLTWTIKPPVNFFDIQLRHIFASSFSNSAAMIRKSLLDDLKIRYDENMIPADDYDLWIRILKNSKGTNIPDILIKARQHQFNTSRMMNADRYRNTLKIRQNYLDYYFCNEYSFEQTLLITESIGGIKNYKRSKCDVIFVENFFNKLKEIIKVSCIEKNGSINLLKNAVINLYMSSMHLKGWILIRMFRSDLFSYRIFIKKIIKKLIRFS
jgi:glycosyltransferase involved in cell wall biosynthesis